MDAHSPPSSSESILDPEKFYRDLLHALGEHARRKGATAQGAAAVAKRVAREHGLAIAERLPLPRLTRAEREDAEIGQSSFRSRP